jgi:predicted DNA-binding transcriptional regulator AlpA
MSPTKEPFNMTLREREVAVRRRIFRKQPSHAEAEREHHRDRVLSFPMWCDLNGFSIATGRRIINAGNGPPVLQLSPRRIGIKESANAAWQASRAR